jgi:hypothetical protein
MEPVGPLTDYFQEGLNINNYFDLIEYCEHLKIKLCDNPEFWKIKYKKEFQRIYNINLNSLKGPEFKADYQTALSDQLHNLVYYPEINKKIRKFYQDIYGNDKLDLLDKAENLRKEANKVFPMEYDKTLYRVDIGYPYDIGYAFIRQLVGIMKPGQLIVYSQSNRNLEGSTFAYLYQIGDKIAIETTDYPEFPDKLLQDTPRNQIKEIYGINIYGEKI